MMSRWARLNSYFQEVQKKMDAQENQYKEVRYDSTKRFADICNLALKQGGTYQITWRTRNFKTNETTGYDENDVTFVVANLLKRQQGLLVDYRIIMDSKECRDVIWVRPRPAPVTSLKAEAKKL